MLHHIYIYINIREGRRILAGALIYGSFGPCSNVHPAVYIQYVCAAVCDPVIYAF